MKRRNRALLTLGTIALSFELAGCMVPAARYDEATAKLRDEQSAHQKTENDLSQVKAELARLEESLHGQERSLETREGELAQSKLDADKVATERDDAVQLVEQLRGELARVGDNLREFSDQKQELEASLAAADTKAKELDRETKRVARSELVIRDLSVALAPEISSGKVLLGLVDGKPVVRLSGSAAFSGPEFGADVTAVFEKVASTLAPSTGTDIELADRSSDDASAADRVARLKRIVGVLAGKGLSADRVGVNVAPMVDDSAKKTEASVPSASAWRDGPGSVEIVIDVT